MKVFFTKRIAVFALLGIFSAAFSFAQQITKFAVVDTAKVYQAYFRNSAPVRNYENKKEEFKLRNYEIQKNITEKFIRTFNRLTFHLDGIEITSYPYEISEFLEAKINNIKEINNPILENIYNELNSNLSKRIK